MGIIRRARRPLLWGSVGAAVAYLADRDRGPDRRARLKEQVNAAVQRRSGGFGQTTDYLSPQPKGASTTADPLSGTQGVPADKVLADKVRSEVLGRPEFRDLDVLVESFDGVVTLRGELADQGVVQQLETAVAAVAGVQRVENFLHPPEAPAPNKEAAREAS